MKKFISGMLILLVLYVIVYDLKIGTLPAAALPQPHKIEIENKKDNYSLKTVKPGETVLSIIEKNSGSQKVNMVTIVQDFKRLNPSVDPDRIIPGKTYKFPLYAKDKR
jgi:hypothetical protein